MASTIKLKNGSGAPLASDLVQGEPALDLTNKRLYTEDSGGTVIEVGTNPSTLTTSSADINGGTIDGVTIGGASAGAITATTITGSGDMNIDSGTLFVDVSENRVGIGTTTPASMLTLKATTPYIRLERDGVDTWQIQQNQISSETGFSVNNITAGTTPFFIGSSGNVGIGTASPSYKLDVATIAVATNQTGEVRFGANDQYSLRLGTYTTDGGAPYAQILAPKDVNGWLAFTTGASDTERMRIDSSGNLLVGTTSANGKVNVRQNVSDGATSTLMTFSDNVNASHFQIKRTDNVSGGFWEGVLEIRATEANGLSDQNIVRLVGKTGAVFMPFVYGDAVTGRDMYIASNGQLGYLSSIRDSKTNIENLSDTSWIYDLEPVKFNYRVKDSATDTYTDVAEPETQYGLIAEDVEAVNSDLVFYNETEEGEKSLAGVQYSRLIAPLLKAIQEQNKRIETLEAEVASLKGN